VVTTEFSVQGFFALGGQFSTLSMPRA
jgi:hypothetical protein